MLQRERGAYATAQERKGTDRYPTHPHTVEVIFGSVLCPWPKGSPRWILNQPECRVTNGPAADGYTVCPAAIAAVQY